MQAILSFLTEIFSQPAFLMGLIAFVGLVALRSPGNKLLTGTLKPILGYLMLSAGAGVIVAKSQSAGRYYRGRDLISAALFRTMKPLSPSPRKCWAWKP
ncbi:transport protein SgaT [Klebsiella pneumoniae]|uniref:Ascorbate-specific PTS system EIIC component n=1 Tax=Klebsiella pneumoniae TaxID=573 RepID=A0A3S5DHX6_KLEPN|nr:transport protein SgaT [Klebsiella pneumoniae]